MNKTVYKKDTKGKIRKTTIFVTGNIITQRSGIVGSDKATEHTSFAKEKNVGKTNYKTPEEQAVIEAEAKITKKIKEGYFPTAEEAEKSEVLMPMLAKPYEKEAHKIDWTDAYVQPKLDGMRCLDTLGGKLSRKNTPIDTMDHIVVVRPPEETIAVDGELYAHGLSFQENMKLIKKLRPESKEVKLHVYDIVAKKLPFKDRYSYLKAIVINSVNLELVPTKKVESEEELKVAHAEFLSQGYEGTMLRWGKDGYKVNGRSSNLLKYKDFLDLSAEVVDVVPSDKNPSQGVVHCIYKGQTFGCGMKFSHAEREEILTKKSDYIGKTAELRFFEFTDGGIPRFPVCVGFRLDK